MSEDTNTRWREIKSIWKNTDTLHFYQLLGGVILVSIISWLGRGLFPTGEDTDYSYRMSVFMNALSVISTIVVLEVMARWREERALKNQLLRDASGQSSEVAKKAIDELREHGWAEGENSLLKGYKLRYANLANCDLWGVNLMGANLRHANLRNAVFYKANLTGADLTGANLVGIKVDAETTCIDETTILPDGTRWAEMSDLTRFTDTSLITDFWRGYNLYAKDLRRKTYPPKANLQRAVMRNCDVRGVDLQGARLERAILFLADLRGTILRGANLTDAELGRAEFGDAPLMDTETILPDGTHWTTETDMTRFTDSKHPDFWRSHNPNSPAFQDKKED